MKISKNSFSYTWSFVAIVVACVAAYIFCVMQFGSSNNYYPDPPNDDFSTGLFLGDSNIDYASGVTSITFIKTKFGLGRRHPDELVPLAKTVIIETNRNEVLKLVDCFRSSGQSTGERLIKTSEQWHIIIYNRTYGRAHVTLMSTDRSNVFSVKLNSSGTSCKMVDCFSSKEKSNPQ